MMWAIPMPKRRAPLFGDVDANDLSQNCTSTAAGGGNLHSHVEGIGHVIDIWYIPEPSLMKAFINDEIKIPSNADGPDTD